MTYNLFDISHRVAAELGALFFGTATGGSTTTIIDTIYLANRFQSDDWNAGTAWITYDAGGAGAAPQGEYKRVSDFVSSTGTVTLESALTAAIASGDKYGLADDEFTFDMIAQFVNEVLEGIKIPQVDVATITTASEKTEYTLPTALLDQDIRVWIQQEDTANHNQWLPLHGWYIQQSSTGSAKVLVFPLQPNYTWDLKIEYWIPHPPLYAKTDKLYEDIDLKYVVLAAARQGLVWKLKQNVGDANLEKKIAEIESRLSVLEGGLPERDRQRVKLGTYGDFEGM